MCEIILSLVPTVGTACTVVAFDRKICFIQVELNKACDMHKVEISLCRLCLLFIHSLSTSIFHRVKGVEKLEDFGRLLNFM